MGSKEITEARLHSALERLLQGKPERVKTSGKLSLNRINNEAGLGHSYIHKFEKFVQEVANPAIEKFNQEYEPAKFDFVQTEISEVDKLKVKLSKEKKLKKKYRQQRDDAVLSNKELEKHNSTLMFRVFELQEIIRSYNMISISKGKN